MVPSYMINQKDHTFGTSLGKQVLRGERESEEAMPALGDRQLDHEFVI